MGTRYVEVFKAAPEQMAAALHRAGKSNNLAPGLPHGGMGMGGMGGPVPYAYGPFSMPPPMPPPRWLKLPSALLDDSAPSSRLGDPRVGCSYVPRSAA